MDRPTATCPTHDPASETSSNRSTIAPDCTLRSTTDHPWSSKTNSLGLLRSSPRLQPKPTVPELRCLTEGVRSMDLSPVSASASRRAAQSHLPTHLTHSECPLVAPDPACSATSGSWRQMSGGRRPIADRADRRQIIQMDDAKLARKALHGGVMDAVNEGQKLIRPRT